MPELKIKARWTARLARALLALVAPLTLTACLPEMISNSALFSPKPQTPPRASIQEEAPVPQAATPLAPYGETIVITAGPPETDLLAVAAPEVAEPTATAAPEADPSAMALHSYQPALPPQTFTLASGLIDQDIFESFSDRLVTAQAGGHLLAAHSLTTVMDYEPYEPFEAPPALAQIDPAPSAGELSLPNQTKARGQGKQPAARTKSLLTAAYEQTGRHYKRGGGSPLAGFDAVGYTHWVFAREGLTLPKTPAGLASAGAMVTKENLRPGDVLIYRNQADQIDGWHVGIYSGHGNFLHASPKAGVVTETDAFGPQYAPYFLGGRRFFDDPNAAPLPDSYKMTATSTAVKLALTELGPEDKVKKPAKPRKAAKPKAKKAGKK